MPINRRLFRSEAQEEKDERVTNGRFPHCFLFAVMLVLAGCSPDALFQHPPAGASLRPSLAAPFEGSWMHEEQVFGSFRVFTHADGTTFVTESLHPVDDVRGSHRATVSQVGRSKLVVVDVSDGADARKAMRPIIDRKLRAERSAPLPAGSAYFIAHYRFVSPDYVCFNELYGAAHAARQGVLTVPPGTRDFDKPVYITSPFERWAAWWEGQRAKPAGREDFCFVRCKTTGEERTERELSDTCEAAVIARARKPAACKSDSAFALEREPSPDKAFETKFMDLATLHLGTRITHSELDRPFGEALGVDWFDMEKLHRALEAAFAIELNAAELQKIKCADGSVQDDYTLRRLMNLVAVHSAAQRRGASAKPSPR